MAVVFKGIKKIAKGIGKVVKKVVKGVMSIIPEELRGIALAAALVFGAFVFAPTLFAGAGFAGIGPALGLGPVASAAVSTGAAWAAKGAAVSASLTAIQGGSGDDVLRAAGKGAVTGAVTGGVAGATSAATGIGIPGVEGVQQGAAPGVSAGDEIVRGGGLSPNTPASPPGPGIAERGMDWARENPALASGIITGAGAAVGSVGGAMVSAADTREAREAEEAERRRRQESYIGVGDAYGGAPGVAPFQPLRPARTFPAPTPVVRMSELRRRDK